MNNKMTVVIISLSMLMSLAVSAAGRPSLRAHEQRITTLEGQTSTLATDLADIALTPGPKGDVGEAGPKGEEGVKGDVGEDGTQGTPGIKGDDGAAGNRGEDGSDGLNGVDAIAGTANGQMQYWDGDTWQIISAPDMLMSEAQVLTPHEDGFRWVTADSITPGDDHCPAFTLEGLTSTIDYFIHDGKWQHDDSSVSLVVTPDHHIMTMDLRYSQFGETITYFYDIWISRDSEVSIFMHINSVTFRDRVMLDYSAAQIRKCQEILGHASLPFIAP
jgi:hypothetical protein